MNSLNLDFEIREAKQSDYPDLLPLFEQIDSLHRINLPKQFQKPPGESRKENYYFSLLSDNDVCFLVAEKEDQIVGFIHTVLRETPPYEIFIPRHFAVIDSIVVKENYQRKGVGRKLVEAAHNWAKSKGAEYIDLNVYEFNEKAINFYKDLGYTTISQRLRKELSLEDKNDAG